MQASEANPGQFPCIFPYHSFMGWSFLTLDLIPRRLGCIQHEVPEPHLRICRDSFCLTATDLGDSIRVWSMGGYRISHQVWVLVWPSEPPPPPHGQAILAENLHRPSPLVFIHFLRKRPHTHQWQLLHGKLSLGTYSVPRIWHLSLFGKRNDVSTVSWPSEEQAKEVGRSNLPPVTWNHQEESEPNHWIAF